VSEDTSAGSPTVDSGGTELSPDGRRRAVRSHQDEVDSVAIYTAMSEVESDASLAEVYRRLAAAEARHVAHWATRLAEAGTPPGPARPSLRARVLIWLARRFGPGLVLPTIASGEASGHLAYVGQPEVAGTALAADERSHLRLLQTIVGPAAPRGMEGASLARLEGRHRAVGGNALRAAVLGANDGLVSDLSLVMGVAGANLASRSVLITGLAGLLAGAISMALGEWLSVQSSRELYTHQLEVEASELAEHPEEEAEELALIYRAKGLGEAEARQLASRLTAEPSTALDTLAREELGIEPGELGGSPLQASAASFLLFAVGAVPPVLPFALLSGGTAVLVSLAASAVALFAIGAATTLVTARSVWFSGLRQLAFGLSAAGITYGIGSLIGAGLG